MAPSMIIIAIFIETFFSVCGACAFANAVSATDSTAAPTNLLESDMFFSLGEPVRSQAP
jgi:hypothetical protein